MPASPTRSREPGANAATGSGRPASVERFLRGCAWPAADGVPYPRCDPGPSGQRLPAHTRAQAALPVGVRLEFQGEPIDQAWLVLYLASGVARFCTGQVGRANGGQVMAR